MFRIYFFFFKQKTAYEMRISDWSSDVCSSDLLRLPVRATGPEMFPQLFGTKRRSADAALGCGAITQPDDRAHRIANRHGQGCKNHQDYGHRGLRPLSLLRSGCGRDNGRSEENTSELQSLMRISYAVFCLKKKKIK